MAKQRSEIAGDESKYLQILFKRQCEYSDYLDELQRSSQRYYFIALSGFLGVLATIYNTLSKESPCDALCKVQQISNVGAFVLIVFGIFTLHQLASLRALNSATDLRMKWLQYMMAQKANVANLFPDVKGPTKPFPFGNDWIKASFVALGNAILVTYYFRESGIWIDALVLLLFLELNLFYYGLLFEYRLSREQERKASFRAGANQTLFLNAIAPIKNKRTDE